MNYSANSNTVQSRYNEVFNQEFNSQKDIKVVIVGDGDVGKTSMLISYTTNEFPSQYVPTVFDNYVVTFLVNDQSYNMLLVDTAGQEEYRSIINLAFQDVDIFILCFAVNNSNSLINAETYWAPILRHHSPKTPILLVGTKSDMAICSDSVTYSQIMNVKKNIKALKYVECSALTQKGLKQVFDSAIYSVINDWDSKSKSKICTGKCEIL